MKLLFDFLPIILFFGAFKYAEGHKSWASDFATSNFGFMVSGGKVGPEEAPVLLATAVVILATLAQVIWLKLRSRKVETMLWVSLILVVLMGGLTIYLRSETFIKWKPSVLYWCMGLAFWLSPLMFGKNLLKLMMGDQLNLPAKIWHRLNFAWITFFAIMGFINLWVAYNFSTDTWVNFKLFGSLGLMLIFTLAQGLYLSKYLSDEPAKSPPESDAGRPG
jgi:intracellular septation protein